MTTQEAATVRYGDSDSARDRLLRLQEDLEEIQRHAARLVEELDQLHAQVSEWWVATVLQTEWLRLHDAGNDTETVFACLCADCLSPIDIRVAHYQYEPNPVSMHKFTTAGNVTPTSGLAFTFMLHVDSTYFLHRTVC